MKTISLLLAALCCAAGSLSAQAADVYGRRFDEPRVYFAQASLNKGGTVHALRGQENFLRLYMPALAADAAVDPQALTFTVTLPAQLRLLDDGGEVLHIEADGQTQRITSRFDVQQVRDRCITNAWGVERILWFTFDPAAKDTADITVTANLGDAVTWTDRASLVVHGALTDPPPLDPARFKVWLHYGPHVRNGDYDALAHYLRRAGINAVQVMAWNDGMIRAMKQRGFYVIAQRGGSYHTLHEHIAEAAEQGAAWFEAADGGVMATVIGDADAVLWDFEPTPQIVYDQPKLLAQFAAETGIKADPKTISTQHLDAWSRFTQKLYGRHVRAWAQWSRSLRPDIETILTEGRCNVFDPMGQTDYRQIATDVTYCDPMNFSGLNSIHGMRSWIAAAPEARFAGCQNVALHAWASVFASADTIMLQTISAALLGNAGTSVYPGQTMDAENFIRFNRVMTFLGKHQEAIFAGARDPRDVTLTLLPREDRLIDLGGGRTIRNIYPDWRSDAVTGVYRAATGDSLVVIANWNATEPCFARIARPGASGGWHAVDDENRLAFASTGGETVVRIPPGNFRGFRTIAGAAPAGYAVTDVSAELRDYLGGSGEEAAQSEQFTYDDIDADGQFEYVITSGAQRLWIDQGGRIVQWQAGDVQLSTRHLGLGRDMLWLPAVERGNTAMDAPMKLVQRSADPRTGSLTLTFERNVTLPGVGGQSSVVIEKRYAVAADRADVTVSVNVAFNSLAAKSVDLSYRVHNHLADGYAMWVDGGGSFAQYEGITSVSVVNEDLTDAQRTAVFGGYLVSEPVKPARFGAYSDEADALWTIVPHDSDGVLQLMRWGAADQSTVEWMHRPTHINGAGTWSCVYDMSLRRAAELDRAAVDDAMPRRVGAGEAAKLLFHVDFNDTADAVTAVGHRAAMVDGDVMYEPTPTGRGLVVSGGATVSWFAEGNIDPMRGKLFMRVKPRWSGGDGKTHFFLTLRPTEGFVYLGKLDDGRLLMNHFDTAGGQHYPWSLVRGWEADRWYELTVTWDAAQGRMALYVDGAQLAAHEGAPWRMASFDDAQPHCRITIPADADALIDEIKVWDRP